ncbi:MAG: uncharacterized protein KVP18_003342 [Porospora cf. gigantea A]|uniref:uncharacterized protein n=2 Tax=Porospora cf. gigantea A TaxID=2853593 RepID=UPI00355A6AFE|nr:MAG: hypothetical protein KVP18_003342 [Porospora cf. gigantea A]
MRTEPLLPTSGKTENGSDFAAGMNMVVATLGAGLLPLPSVFQKTGAVPAMVMLAVIGTISKSSTLRITNCLDVADSEDFETLCLKTGGSKLQVLGSAMISLFCLGTAVGYLITLVSCLGMLRELVHLLFGWYMPSPHILLVLAVAFVVTPLCMQSSLAALQYSSTVGVSSVLLLALVTLGRLALCGGDFSSPRFILLGDGKTSSALEALSLLTFAFACQPNVPEIYHDLQEKRHMSRIASRSFNCCIAVYTLTGLAGSLAFGTQTSSNLLDNFAMLVTEDSSVPEVVVTGVVCVAMIINVLMAYPMNVYPVTTSLVHACSVKSRMGRSLVTAGNIAATLALALTCPSISRVFSLVGATTGAMCVFILPSIFVLRLAGRIPGHTAGLQAWGLLVFVAGTLLCVLGTYQAV